MGPGTRRPGAVNLDKLLNHPGFSFLFCEMEQTIIVPHRVMIKSINICKTTTKTLENLLKGADPR